MVGAEDDSLLVYEKTLLDVSPEYDLSSALYPSRLGPPTFIFMIETEARATLAVEESVLGAFDLVADALGVAVGIIDPRVGEIDMDEDGLTDGDAELEIIVVGLTAGTIELVSDADGLALGVREPVCVAVGLADVDTVAL